MTNKMTETELHNVLDNVKESDEIRATYGGKARKVYEGEEKAVYFGMTRELRTHYGRLAYDLISVENLGQPEPEVGSFALLDDGSVMQCVKNGWYYYYTDDDLVPYKFNDIKPRIKVLYNPDGSVNEGWK